ncbi:MAG: TonB-dependent siderophore receptor [Burkholderiaceae bacterium]
MPLHPSSGAASRRDRHRSRRGCAAPRLRRLVGAVHFACAALAAGAAAAPGALHAQAALRTYDIPAGPLAAALTRFVAESGILLAGTSELARGVYSPGLKGAYGDAAGLAALLAGTGLEAVRGPAGDYQLRRIASAGPDTRTSAAEPSAAGPAAAATLPAVTVSAAPERSAVTEGTRSYTSAVTTTSTRLPLSPRETPQSISVITRQRLDDQGLNQLTDAIVQTPGLVLSGGGNTGTDSTPIYSRGFSVDTYMLDGVQQFDSNYDSVYQTNDLAIVDRIEVVRGASGLMNGVGTPAGAINVVRKRPLPHFAASARVEVGSWDHQRVQGDISTLLNEAGTLRARFVGALQRNDYYIDRLHEKRDVLYGVAELDVTPETLVHAGFSYQHHRATGHARNGLPSWFSDGTRTDWRRSDSAAASWAYSNRRMSSLFAGVEHTLNADWKLKGTVSRTTTVYDELIGYASRGYPDRATGSGAGLWAGRWTADPRQDSLDLNAIGKFSLFGRQHDLVVGALMARTFYDTPNYTNWTHAGWDPMIADLYTWDGNTPAEPNNPSIGRGRSDERINSAYATVRFKPADSVGLILGARVTDWSRYQSTLTYATGATTITDRNESGVFTPYAGLTVDVSRHWSAYASYTSIFKPQNNRLTDGRYMDPQRGDSYELGVKGAFYEDRLNVSAAIYEARQDNLAVSIPGVFAPDGSQAYRAVSGTKTRGFEFEVAGQLLPGWQLAASFARNQTQDRDGAPLNTDIPQSVAKLFTTYRLGGAADGFVVGGGVRWQNRIYSDNQGPDGARFEQPSYAVVDLMARYPIDRRFSVSANLYNVLDKEYYLATASSYKGAPRYLRVALEARY